MPLSDLQEQLQQLGYGNQWQQVQQKMAVGRQILNQSDVERIKQHNRQFPQKHKAAKARWAKRRLDQIKDRIGKQKCNRCFRQMKANDLIGQNRLNGHCRLCRKDLLG